ncbi:MAG: phosphatase PAP2 family protein [Bacteroidetes bacterium]|nr:phosphatase PAP2 family protein [Bacteroidota bacterium]
MTPAFTNQLIEADQQFFLWLNGLHSPFWDVVMQGVTNKFTWIPLYVLLLYGIIRQFGKKSVGYLLAIVAVVALSDQIASGFFKPYFMRPRPCHDPALADLLHLVGNCGGAYGFISSHAATGFGIATILNLLPTRQLLGVRWLFVWAAVYSYSRIYVGVHYPLDILVGALMGSLAAGVVYILYEKTAGRLNSEYL